MPRYQSYANQTYRIVWSVCSLVFIRLSLRPFFAWRRWVLVLFGAKMAKTARVYPTTVIHDPRKLVMGSSSCLADHVKCYNVDYVIISSGSTVSQYSMLCTAGHDISEYSFRLVTDPIKIGSNVWVCSNCFISPGAVLADGSVLLPCSCLVKDTYPNSIFAGVPARFKKYRN